MADPSRCANRGTPLRGASCHACGQKDAEADWQSVRDLVRQFHNELISLDFKSLRTLAALIPINIGAPALLFALT